MIYQYNEYPEFRGNNLFKKHKHDAGWDIRTPKGIHLAQGQSCVVYTGLHICVPKGMKGIIQSRSGGSIFQGVEMGNAGVIDYGYTGECLLRMYNFSPDGNRVEFAAGDRVAQIVFDTSHTVSGWDFLKLYWDLFTKGIPQVIPEVPLCEWPATDRGNGGFNSTGLS